MTFYASSAKGSFASARRIERAIMMHDLEKLSCQLDDYCYLELETITTDLPVFQFPGYEAEFKLIANRLFRQRVKLPADLATGYWRLVYNVQRERVDAAKRSK